MTTAKPRAGKKIWPLPEILEGGLFKLKESKQQRGMVCTNLVDKIMIVPTEDNAYGRMGRLHEMAHVAITPTDGMQEAADRDIGSDYVNVAEDMRVHMFLKEKKFELEPSMPEELLLHRAKGWQLEGDFKTACLMAVASYNLPEYKLLLSQLDTTWQEKIERTVINCKYYFEDYRTFESTLQAARYLQDMFNEDNLKYLEKEINADIAAAVGNQWGEMKLLTPPLTVHLPQRRLNRKVRPNEFGGTLMFPTRLDTDGKIFGNTRRIAKGTVLIDVSSSMSLESYQIQELVKEIPGVTVAVYSGENLEGHLTIIAKNGSMLKGEEMSGWPGGNVVDGPALKWLAKQAEPRIWVCDGGVTGVYDTPGTELNREAFEIEAKGNIERTRYIDSAARLMKK